MLLIDSIFTAAENGIHEVVRYLDEKRWFDISNDGTVKYKIPFDKWFNKTGIDNVDRLNELIGDNDENFFAIEEGGDGDTTVYVYIVAGP